MLRPTPAPPDRRGTKRKRLGASSGPTAQGYPSCDNVGNTVLSCFPTANTTLIQGVYSRFIWNANYPTFIAGRGTVDAYLFYADSMEVARNWTNMANDAGMCAILPDDDWWGARREARELQIGRNRTWEFYFVVVPGGVAVTGSQVRQETFAAVQTLPPRTVLATMSASSTSQSSSTRATADPTGTGSLQNDNPSSGPGFPKWAIAVIVILGALLALTSLGIVIALLRRRSRRDDERTAQGTSSDGKDGPSSGRTGLVPITSTSKAAYDEKEPIHHVPAPAAAATAAAARSVTPSAVPVPVSRPSQDRTRHTPSPAPAAAHLRPTSRTSLYPPLASPLAPHARQRSASYTATAPASATTTSDQPSVVSPGRITVTEAAAVADAFRQAMRKPDFVDIPTEEGESPESEDRALPATPSRIMQRELSGEGVGVRAVDDRRAYLVEGEEDEDAREGR